jgi:LmbE family N-acetylglucosaminyl deacetylase
VKFVPTRRSLSNIENTFPFKANSIAILAPHADDEILGCFHFIEKFGGDNRIDLIYVTDSANPFLSDIRKSEAFEATKRLPIKKRFWWHFEDGKLNRSCNHLESILSKVNNDYDFVLSPAFNDKTSDHAILGATALGVVESSKLIWYRSTWLTFPLRASDFFIYGSAIEKQRAIKYFKSQGNLALLNVVNFSKVEAKLSGIFAESVEAFRFASSDPHKYKPLNTLSIRCLWHIRTW